jgi:hypothetical protein
MNVVKRDRTEEASSNTSLVGDDKSRSAGPLEREERVKRSWQEDKILPRMNVLTGPLLIYHAVTVNEHSAASLNGRID